MANPFERLLKVAGLLALGGGGGWIAYSNLAIDRSVPLPRALAAERRSFISPRAGEISYYVDAESSGTPLVLIHSINAAASAFEMKPLFEHYRGQRPVYAMDLPGFGFSERSDRRYSPTLYANAISDFITQEIGTEVDLIALSLGSEFAAMAILNQPGLVRSLVLLSPTGVGDIPEFPGDVFYNIVAFPLWGRPLFDLLTIRPSINYFLELSFADGIPEGFAEYAYATAHQPGGHYAPLYFVAGLLFTADIRQRVYTYLRVPTLAIYGGDPNVTFDNLPELLDANTHWRAVRVNPNYRLPHWEDLEETTGIIEAFWEEAQP